MTRQLRGKTLHPRFETEPSAVCGCLLLVTVLRNSVKEVRFWAVAGDIHAIMAALAGEDLLLDQAAARLGLSPAPRSLPLPPPQLMTQLRLEQTAPPDPGSDITKQDLGPGVDLFMVSRRVLQVPGTVAGGQVSPCGLLRRLLTLFWGLVTGLPRYRDANCPGRPGQGAISVAANSGR
jgi:hypothetical protein